MWHFLFLPKQYNIIIIIIIIIIIKLEKLACIKDPLSGFTLCSKVMGMNVSTSFGALLPRNNILCARVWGCVCVHELMWNNTSFVFIYCMAL